MSTTAVDHPQTRTLSRGAGLIFLILFALIPLIFHGCHGGDADHEPTVLPVRTQSE